MNTEFTQSQSFRIVLIVIVAMVLLMAGFSLGERVGFRKASFAYQNGNNFYRTFGPGGTHGGPAEFSDAHGVAGKVVSINLPTMVVENRDNTEKTVIVNDKTVIRHLRDTLAATDITVGSYVVAIGDPNAQSQIAATLIRILPAPPSAQSAQ